MKEVWHKVGVIGVDAGICWIGDPCYILDENNPRPKDIGTNWDEFCEALRKRHDPKQYSQFNYDMGHPGLGVCVSTGYGDGEYPVLVKKTKDGRIKAAMVIFIEGDED